MFAFLLERLQTLGELAGFGFPVLETLLDARDLPGLRIDQTARTFNFDAHFGQALAGLSQFRFSLIAALTRRGKLLFTGLDLGLQALGFERCLLQLSSDARGFTRQQVVTASQRRAQL